MLHNIEIQRHNKFQKYFIKLFSLLMRDFIYFSSRCAASEIVSGEWKPLHVATREIFIQTMMFFVCFKHVCENIFYFPVLMTFDLSLRLLNVFKEYNGQRRPSISRWKRYIYVEYKLYKEDLSHREFSWDRTKDVAVLNDLRQMIWLNILLNTTIQIDGVEWFRRKTARLLHSQTNRSGTNSINRFLTLFLFGSIHLKRRAICVFMNFSVSFWTLIPLKYWQ